MSCLQPLCPAIVYSNIFNSTQKTIIDLIMSKLKDKHKETFKNLPRIIDYVTGYTIIGMELMDNYKTAYSFLNPIEINIKIYDKELLKNKNTLLTHDDLIKINTLKNEKEQIQNMILFAVINMCLKTGYFHADFHTSNIMINFDDTTYFQGMKGSIIMIDFGLAVKIRADYMEKLNYYYEQKDFTPFLI